MALRSHFYMGADLPDLGVSPEEIEALVPDEFGQGLLQHAYDEFTYLSALLPRCLSPNTAIRGRRERRGERLCHRCAPLDMPSRVPGPER